MYNPRLPRSLQLSKPLSPEEVSLAWKYLANLQEQHQYNPEPPLPPRSLRRLSDSDWHLLDNLLARELLQRNLQPLH